MLPKLMARAPVLAAVTNIKTSIVLLLALLVLPIVALPLAAADVSMNSLLGGDCSSDTVSIRCTGSGSCGDGCGYGYACLIATRTGDSLAQAVGDAALWPGQHCFA